MHRLSLAAVAATALALPAFAQSPPANKSDAAMTAPATHDVAGNPIGSGYNTPSQRNPVMTDQGGVRIGKVIGSDVYNDKDQKLGSIDGVILDRNHKLQAILSADNRLVEVPFEKLQFGNTKTSGDNQVVLPGATKDPLRATAEYHYTNQG